ncbi:MAG: GPR endopeptidase [Oscillospiraceae bacterium]
MLKRRTDLAVETAPASGTRSGVSSAVHLQEGFSVTVVEVLDETGAQGVGKPVGRYVTLELDGLQRREEGAFPRAVRALAAELTALLPVAPSAPVLVVGLGNRAMTPDAVGPLAVGCTLVTRHLVAQLPLQFGAFRPISALAAGVLGDTGMESGELVAAVVAQTKPCAVIAIDALASRSVRRLCTNLQLADTGIVPGSGVGNHRHALNRETLGVPVVALGVATVVDSATLALDLLEEAGVADLDPQCLGGLGGDLFVTPRDIDARVAEVSKVIGYGISLALNPQLTVEDLTAFLE